MSKVGKQIIAALEEALADARGEPTGIRKRVVMIPTKIDVKAIRRRLKMSQRAFAERFGFALGTLQNWERGHRRPEGAARALLTVIDRRPEAVLEALSSDASGHRAPSRKRRAAAAAVPSHLRKSVRRS